MHNHLQFPLDTCHWQNQDEENVHHLSQFSVLSIVMPVPMRVHLCLSHSQFQISLVQAELKLGHSLFCICWGPDKFQNPHLNLVNILAFRRMKCTSFHFMHLSCSMSSQSAIPQYSEQNLLLRATIHSLHDFPSPSFASRSIGFHSRTLEETHVCLAIVSL